jgi:hypothetical protein
VPHPDLALAREPVRRERLIAAWTADVTSA